MIVQMEDVRRVRQLEAKRKWRAENHEKVLGYARKRYAANADRINEAKRKRRVANPEKARAAERRLYEMNAERERARTRKNYAADPEKHRAAVRKSSKAHPERVRARKQRWNAANRDRNNANTRKRREANPEPHRAEVIKYRKEHPAIVQRFNARRALHGLNPGVLVLDRVGLDICYDDGCCYICCQEFIENSWWSEEVDHLIPMRPPGCTNAPETRGSDAPDNKLPICAQCNRRKSNHILVPELITRLKASAIAARKKAGLPVRE